MYPKNSYAIERTKDRPLGGRSFPSSSSVAMSRSLRFQIRVSLR